MVGHPLVAAGVSMAEGGGYVFTGRISTRTQPWLADHMVLDRALVPGAALLELVLGPGSTWAQNSWTSSFCTPR